MMPEDPAGVFSLKTVLYINTQDNTIVLVSGCELILKCHFTCVQCAFINEFPFLSNRQPVTKNTFRQYRVLGKGGFGEVRLFSFLFSFFCINSIHGEHDHIDKYK